MTNGKTTSKTGKTRSAKGAQKGRAKAVSPAEKARSSRGSGTSAPVPASAPVAGAPLLSESQHRGIHAIVCLVAALALALIVAWPTNAVVTATLSQALRLVFGVGAYLLPVLLVVAAFTLVARFV